MALSAGTRIGAYQIIDQIGSGGMGEVYRATDTKLGRDVAIKTLPSALAREPDRLARFEREAKLLATLNHAHIGAIYGLDEHEGTQFIAMELIEGETLDEKLKDGPLPVEDALQFGLQIAEALEAAHEKGVVHRDLKPANIMLTPDGVVKVLDFGLAKAFSGDPNKASPAHSPALSMAMTQQGLILGTAGYMSPEQASGQATDQRADIWAFGVVLYEMLTGLPLFSGESVPHILADVLRTEPDWGRLPTPLHPRVRLLLEHCLKKRVRDRCHSIADARIDIEDVLKDPEGVAVAAAMGPPRQPHWRRALSGTAAVLITGFVVGVGVQYFFAPAMSLADRNAFDGQISRPVRRFSLDLGPTTPIANTTLNAHIAVSRDGRRFAYAVNVGGRSQLFVRDLDQQEARAVPDSAGAQHPFFSPDGEWVAFFADGTDNKLKRVAFRGGPAQALTDINGAGGGYWGEDDNIVFSTNPEGLRSLLRVPATGGTPEFLLPQPELGADGDVWPAPLPGGKALLFVLRPHGNGPIQDGNIALLSLETGEYRVLIRGAHRPQYVPTGHIVFVRAGSLWAVPFDAERLAITGPEVSVIDGVQQNSQIGGAAYAFSNDGMLIYLAGGESLTQLGGAPKNLVWVDREGHEQPLDVEPRPYWDPRLSPDGRRLAVSVGQSPASDIWIIDLERGTPSRLTFDASASYPLWTPDGERVAYWSGFAGSGGTYWRAANGTGQAQQLTNNLTGNTLPAAFTPDGTTLVYEQGEGGVPISDLYRLPIGSDSGPMALLATENDDCCAAISPDGHWIAYGSDETGQYEIYVRPFPNVDDGKWQISNGGGTEPRWNSNGSELFFLAGGAVFAVPVDYADDTFSWETPVQLFAGNFWDFIDTRPNYDVAPGGQRFLTMISAGAPETQPYSQQTPLTTVENWFEELERLAPPSK